jgi:hypothetical protein
MLESIAIIVVHWIEEEEIMILLVILAINIVVKIQDTGQEVGLVLVVAAVMTNMIVTTGLVDIIPTVVSLLLLLLLLRVINFVVIVIDRSVSKNGYSKDDDFDPRYALD